MRDFRLDGPRAACLFLAEGAEREALNNLHRYYSSQQHRMHSHRYRSNGWPIGSAVLELGEVLGYGVEVDAAMKAKAQHIIGVFVAWAYRKSGRA